MTRVSATITTAIFCIALFSTICLYLLATEKVIISRPALLGDFGAPIDEEEECQEKKVSDVTAKPLAEGSIEDVKAGIKKWNEEIKNGKRN